MSPDDQHLRIMEYFRPALYEPDRMMSMRNLVHVEVIGNTVGGRLLPLNNAELRGWEKLRMHMIPANLTLDSILQYVRLELKFNSENEAFNKDCNGYGNDDRRENRDNQENQDAPGRV